MDPIDLEQVARGVCHSRGYTFVRRVGAGTFKETFHVTQAAGDPLALKIFRPGFNPERTSREVAAMLTCNHPNIGRLYSLFEFDFGSVRLLISLEEFLSGGTLKNRIETQGLLDRNCGYAIGEALIAALSHIASHDLVHRDLKPDNILFRSDGVTPVVVDFGLVRDLGKSSLTQTWVVPGPGTPYFSSPEQLANAKHLIDWRSDQFSLGVLLSICILGFHPFEGIGSTPAQTVQRVAQCLPSTDRFTQAAMDSGFPVLVRMVAPWPVQRARRPANLAKLWCGQRGQD